MYVYNTIFKNWIFIQAEHLSIFSQLNMVKGLNIKYWLNMFCIPTANYCISFPNQSPCHPDFYPVTILCTVIWEYCCYKQIFWEKSKSIFSYFGKQFWILEKCKQMWRLIFRTLVWVRNVARIGDFLYKECIWIHEIIINKQQGCTWELKLAGVLFFHFCYNCLFLIWTLSINFIM